MFLNKLRLILGFQTQLSRGGCHYGIILDTWEEQGLGWESGGGMATHHLSRDRKLGRDVRAREIGGGRKVTRWGWRRKWGEQGRHGGRGGSQGGKQLVKGVDKQSNYLPGVTQGQ